MGKVGAAPSHDLGSSSHAAALYLTLLISNTNAVQRANQAMWQGEFAFLPATKAGSVWWKVQALPMPTGS
eukprot:1157726-Pelagomonas_calceolata.AAC.8